MAPLILGVGELLWDLLPTGKQLGGAPANFAYHAHALGADARLVSSVGDDPLGREAVDRLRSLGLPTDCITTALGRPTGTVEVDLLDGQPRYAIRTDVAWDWPFIPVAVRRVAAGAAAVCFGSLAQRTAYAEEVIRRLIYAAPDTALRVFDVNLRPPFYTERVLDYSLQVANAVKLNDEELPVLAAIFGLAGDAREQIAALADRFDLRHVAYTRGGRGSLLWSGDTWSEHPGAAVTVVDAIGAGDAFTAAWVVGLLAGRPLDAVHAHANAVAAYVCTRSGATPPLPAELLAP